MPSSDFSLPAKKAGDIDNPFANPYVTDGGDDGRASRIPMGEMPMDQSVESCLRAVGEERLMRIAQSFARRFRLEADDLHQEAMVRIWGKGKREDKRFDDPGHFAAYYRKVVNFVALEKTRELRRRREQGGGIEIDLLAPQGANLRRAAGLESFMEPDLPYGDLKRGLSADGVLAQIERDAHWAWRVGIALLDGLDLAQTAAQLDCSRTKVSDLRHKFWKLVVRLTIDRGWYQAQERDDDASEKRLAVTKVVAVAKRWAADTPLKRIAEIERIEPDEVQAYKTAFLLLMLRAASDRGAS